MRGAMFREQACRNPLPLEHQPGIWSEAPVEMDYYRKIPKRHLGPYYALASQGTTRGTFNFGTWSLEGILAPPVEMP
jgi:hypothetical protein